MLTEHAQNCYMFILHILNFKGSVELMQMICIKARHSDAVCSVALVGHSRS